MAKKRTPIVASATVEEGPKVSFDNKTLTLAALTPWIGQRIVVTIAEDVGTRREKQNRYYRGVVVKWIANETGQDADSIHEHLKAKFLSSTVVIENRTTGELSEQRQVQSTTKLNVQDFCDYVEACKVWAAEFLGILIPEADPEYWRKDGKAA